MKNSILAVRALLIIGAISLWMSVSFHHLQVYDYDDHRQLSSNNDWWEPASYIHRRRHHHGTNATSSNTTCFPYNSLEWLTGKRLGNHMSNNHVLVQTSILNLEHLYLFPNGDDSTRQLLGQTICHKESRIVKWNFAEVTTPKGDTSQDIRQLAFRLLYLAIHIHQHKHAIQEAKLRVDLSLHQCQLQMQQQYHVGSFDFECREAKFLVVPLKDRGLGALMRTDAATALQAGIATDRVVLFVNNSPVVGPSFLQQSWSWASCSRYDKQCFFLPDSPCVLTHTDLQNATILTKGERRQVFKTGRVPEHTHNARVIIMDMNTRPQRTPPTFQRRVTQIIEEHLIRPMTEQNPHDPRLSKMSKAIQFVLHDGDSVHDSTSFGYFGRNSTAHHAMILFAMRPNLEYAARLELMMQQVFPADHRTNMRIMLGLPIRASDKCDTESECPPFDLYMDLIQSVWVKHQRTMEANVTHDTVNIILTSESTDVHNARRAYQRSNDSVLFSTGHANDTGHIVPFKFITNEYDLVQNTGDPTKLNTGKYVNKEEILLSTIASLQMQMYSDYSVANCCSNHHLLLVDLLNEGCGINHQDDVAQCMQDHEDQKFHLCCAWTKTLECLEKKERKHLQVAK